MSNGNPACGPCGGTHRQCKIPPSYPLTPYKLWSCRNLQLIYWAPKSLSSNPAHQQGHSVFGPAPVGLFPPPVRGGGRGWGCRPVECPGRASPPHPNLPPPRGGKGSKTQEARGKSRTE